MTQNYGRPADQKTHQDQHEWTGRGGMSLRDWFAGQAIQGVMAGRSNPTVYAAITAEEAYLYADAMIAERDK